MRIAVLGAGAWGSALAVRLSSHAETVLWARSAEQVAAMSADRDNARYLPGIAFPASLQLSADLAKAVAGADYLIAAVPSAGLRGLAQALRELNCRVPLIWLCKGFEADSMKLPHVVLSEVGLAHGRVGVLSGPSFAQEVAQGQPVALTLAAEDEAFARQAAQDLCDPAMRIYSSTDVIGVEIGGALKNVIAIAAGVCDGLGFGYNARAALVTRGLAEMTRLGLKLGGKAETFMGLSGLGDLILTCTGDLSRNRQVGLRLAKGQGLEAILRELGHVAEGVTTAREACRLAKELGVEMPIADAVRRLLLQELTPKEAVAFLLNRDQKAEGI